MTDTVAQNHLLDRCRSGGDPFRRGLGRRDAAHRRPFHDFVRPVRKRPVHACRTSPQRSARPAGTLAGVSAFQVHISDHDILTPGDYPNVLVAMNPAALKANLDDLAAAGTLIVNSDAFDERALAQGGLRGQPAHRREPERVRPLRGPDDEHHPGSGEALGHQAQGRGALQELLRPRPDQLALHPARRPDPRLDRVQVRAHTRWWPRPTPSRSRRGGTSARQPSCSRTHYEVKPAVLDPGTYTNIQGNTALAWGLIAAGQLAKLPLFLGSYPITPASDILHELVQAQELRRADHAGRGRDRRHRSSSRAPRTPVRSVSRPPAGREST